MLGSVEVDATKSGAAELEWLHYYDNSLIFKVTKEQASIGTTWDLSAPPPLAAIWTVLIVFYANHFQRSIGDLWEFCSYNVTSSGLAHERNIRSKMRGQEGNTLQVSTFIDFIQMKSGSVF